MSNYYPPHHLGGYELRCQSVVEALTAREHTCQVLTSTYGVGQAVQEGIAHRVLPQTYLSGRKRPAFLWVLQLLMQEISVYRITAQLLDAWQSDVMYVWSMVGIPKTVLRAAMDRDIPLVFNIADAWLANYDTSDPWLAIWCKAIERRLPWGLGVWARRLFRVGARQLLGCKTPVLHHDLDLRFISFVSFFRRAQYAEAGYLATHARVIHSGINTRRFYVDRANGPGNPLRLLTVGQLLPSKGIHTAIKAVAELGRQGHLVKLDIVGDSSDTGYQTQLKHLIKERDLADQVRLLGRVPVDQMPDLYAQHDVLLFPSVRLEGLPRVVNEAMASGLVVVGTSTGGTGEILRDMESGLVFPPGDAKAAAQQLARLIENPSLWLQLSKAGQQLVIEHFDMQRMVDESEALLRQAVQHAT